MERFSHDMGPVVRMARPENLNEIDEYGMCLSNEMQMMIDGSYQHEYMMLGRLQQDCEYRAL